MTIYDLIEQQRAALLSRDATFLASMTQDWRSVERAIAGRAEALARELKARKARGEQVSQSQLFRLQRYQALARQAREAIVTYAGDKAGAIADNQRRAVAQGEADARAQLDEAGVDTSFMRLNQGAVNVAIGLAADGSPLRNLLAATWPDAVDALTRRLIDNTALGVNPRVTARQMAADSGASLSRMMTIARTEQLRAYREASRATYQAAGIRQYKRIAAKNARTCYICISIDGQIIDVANPMPVHPNCRCGAVPIVPGYQLPQYESAQEWFGKQPDEVQRAMLGVGRFDLFKQGTPLQALARIVNDPIWGPTLQGRTLADVRNNPTSIVDMGKIKAEPRQRKPKPAPQPAQEAGLSAEQLRGRVAELYAKIKPEIEAIDGRIADVERAISEKQGLLRAMTRPSKKLQEEVNNLIREYYALRDKRNNILQDSEASTAMRAALFNSGRAQYTIGALDKRRQFQPNQIGGDAPEDEKRRIAGLLEQARQVLGDRFPKDFKIEITATADGTRSYAEIFDSGRYGIVLSKNVQLKTIIHELGHILAASDKNRYFDRAVAFVERRTAGEKPVRMADLYPGVGYGPNELTLRDKFLHPYVGMIYRDRRTNKAIAEEVISMGLEWLYTNPGWFAENDPDHFDFIMELLRGGNGGN